MKNYSKKIIVVGGGPGGYVAAIRAAQLGANVTLIEKKYLGGTCLNVGCIPTKCLLHSAEMADDINRNSAELGINVTGFEVNFPQVMAHKNRLLQKLAFGISGLLKMYNIQIVEGEARFISPGELMVKQLDGSEEKMAGDAVIIAVGSVNAQLPVLGLMDNPNCVDSTGALSWNKIPESLAVIGGGVIGLELSLAYAGFGTQVSVIDTMNRLLPMIDNDLALVGIRHMKKMGIQFHLESSVQTVMKSPVGAKVVFKTKNGDINSLESEKVLVAVGRQANTAALNLSAGGLYHQKGYLLVNDKMETNVPGIYAVGDCVYGKAQLAHTASTMGEVAAENIMGINSTYDEKTSPTCVYINPEIASVGLTEEQCKEQQISFNVGKFPMVANGKALILNGGEGFVKIISKSDNGSVLGMHITGPHATDLIAEGALAIRMGATVGDLIRTIHSHPTVTETLREAALNAENRAIHIKN